MHMLLYIISISVIVPLYESPCFTPPLVFVPLPFGFTLNVTTLGLNRFTLPLAQSKQLGLV